MPPSSQVGAASLGPGPLPERAGAWRWSPEHDARLQAWAQTVWGRALLVGVFAALGLPGSVSPAYVLAAAAFAYLPAWRSVIALGTAALALVRQSDKWQVWLEPLALPLGGSAVQALVLGSLAAFLLTAWGLLHRTRAQPSWVVARRPVLSQLLALALLLALASVPALPAGVQLALWLLACVWGKHLWVLAYALQDQRSRSPGPMALQMGLFHPFWRASLGSFTPTPFGKGAAFLRRHQATNAQELAITQIKGLKLLAWALLLALINEGLWRIASALGIAPSTDAYAAFVAGQPYPVVHDWASLWVSAASAALALAVLGHKLIAVARLAGFRLPRNTWRPLQARTLADFWNRYYYYFKELLVDFFFFPTFLKMFRQHPRLRVFFATFMAAGVGNALYHFLRDIHLVPAMGWQAAVTGYGSNLFYCTVLAAGIGLSQARLSVGRQLPAGWAGRLWSVLCVWGFFVMLQVFGDESRTFAFGDRVDFFLRLFGV